MKTTSWIPCLIVSLLTVGASSLADDASHLPDAAMGLKRAYKQSIEAASKPIRERYLADLRKLQEQATRAGKLEDAIAIKKEVDSLSPQNFLGKWQEANAPGTITTEADGTARHSGGGAATWEVRDRDVIITWSRWKHVFPSAVAGDTIR